MVYSWDVTPIRRSCYMAQNVGSLVRMDLSQLVQQRGDVQKMQRGLEQILSVQV